MGRRDNLLLVHWHDLGRTLHAYGHPDVSSPAADRLAAQSIVLTNAHAAAPLCSPSRGAIMTGRYPHSNGLVGLAHHGFAYHPGVLTLPHVLRCEGWRTVLYGMQHESSDPATLGYDEYDVSDAHCDRVVDLAAGFLRRRGEAPFLLNTGFFETHRPYPPEEYPPDDPAGVIVPAGLPDTPAVRDDLAAFHGSIRVADAALGRLLDVLDDTGRADDTWVVFFTDHGPALPGQKSTLYEGGTGITLMIRPPERRAVSPHRYDHLFSGVDLLPTLLDALSVDVPTGVQGVSHLSALLGDGDDRDAGDAARARAAAGGAEAAFGSRAGGAAGRDPADAEERVPRSAVFAEKTYHDDYDPIRAVRTEHYLYIENLARRPQLDLPLDILASPSGQAVEDLVAGERPPVELYDLDVDPEERRNVAESAGYARVRAELAARLHEWRRRSADTLPSDREGTEVARRNLERYLNRLPAPDPHIPRSPLAAHRGYTSHRGGPSQPGDASRPDDTGQARTGR